MIYTEKEFSLNDNRVCTLRNATVSDAAAISRFKKGLVRVSIFFYTLRKKNTVI